MTICLGLLCETGRKVVIAADRMLTGRDVEFEQEVQKVHLVTESCAVLAAGSAVEQVEVIRNSRPELASRRNPTVRDVVDELKRQFVATRKRRAEELYLRPLGLDLGTFLQLQSTLAEPLLLRLTRNIEAEELELQLLVAGVDSRGAHIYLVDDPGTEYCFDAIGFCAIGTGEHHAELAFIRSGYSPQVGLNRAVFLAYQAKRDAEMAPGVGARFTDMAVIDQDGVRPLHENVLAALAETYQQLLTLQVANQSEIRSRIDALELTWAEPGFEVE